MGTGVIVVASQHNAEFGSFLLECCLEDGLVGNPIDRGGWHGENGQAMLE